MRLPVTPQLSTKDGTSNKNARLTNVLKEVSSSREFGVIRPGLSAVNSSTGNGNGLVCYNNELISVYGATLGAGTSGGVAFQKINSITPSSNGNMASNGTAAVEIGGGYRTTDGINWTLFNPTGVNGIPDGYQWWFVGQTLYGVNTATNRFLKSVDYGSTWTHVSFAPFSTISGYTFAQVGVGFYLYDIALGDVYRSLDSGATWSVFGFSISPPATSGNPSSFFTIGTTLYIIDGVNREWAVSTDRVDFTLITASAPIQSGYLSGTNFYGHNGSNGDIVLIDSNNLLLSLTFLNVIGNVPLATPLGTFFYSGNPWFVNGKIQAFGLGGMYELTNSLPFVGTLTDSKYDFVQSPL